jgi:ABC-2 type transport system ATP-binding protein
VEDLHRRYGRFDALQGLGFGISEGSKFALIGPNGGGKTTTIKILINLLQPSGGSAAIFGVDSRALSPRELSGIGYVSENQELPGRLTVAHYLDFLRPFYTQFLSLQNTFQC